MILFVPLSLIDDISFEEEEGDAKKAKPKTPEEMYSEIAAELDDKLPNAVDMLAVGRQYPVRYDECLNTVLLMELGKMNKLAKKIKGTLKDLQKAVKGLVVFSPELEDVANGLLANKTPNPWMGVSYPCLKPKFSLSTPTFSRLFRAQTQYELDMWYNNL